jgi:hypothetical protein
LSALLVRLQGIVDVESLERIRWIDGCPTLHINRLVGRGDCSSCVCWAGRFERKRLTGPSTLRLLSRVGWEA